ncbi:hypothetical protein [Janthinobacterium sp.]|uniref:hypothetical protein n=1 Tax=Janthinobacterium sp. TaxID=1871054 RepID=UPI00293DA132|nr:hypothetical protein [Janthinobacterium sp.]
MDFSVGINKTAADGAVLKFAVGMIIHGVDKYSSHAVFEYLLNLSWHFQTLLPYLDVIMSKPDFDCLKYERQLNSIIFENSRQNRSDGMAWPLYFIKKYNIPLHEKTIDSVIGSLDCVAICIIYSIKNHDEKILNFISDKIVKSNLKKIDIGFCYTKFFEMGKFAIHTKKIIVLAFYWKMKLILCRMVM